MRPLVELTVELVDKALKNDALAQAAENLCDGSIPDSLPSGFQLSQGDLSEAAYFSFGYSAKCTGVLEKMAPLALSKKENFREFRET